MKQEKALAILKSGRNVFLTGSAGAGKTFVLNQYIDYLKERKIAVAVTASTGIAATHMNGMTIHSWAGIGIKESLTRAQLVSMKTKKYLAKHLEAVKVLIIDEISMLHQNQLALVNQVLQFFKENSLPFGGIQLVLSGDFFQLPPIGKSGERSKDKFAFMSPVWVQANLNVCYLTEQFRQTDDELNRILNEIRTGFISEQSLRLLENASSQSFQKDIEPTKLYTHNLDVDAINLEHLKSISGKKRYFEASTKGNEKLVETLNNSVLAPENLELKIGAKVMFVKNNLEKGYVNGSLGTVLGFTDDGFPSVKLLNGKTIKVEEENWSIIDDHGKTLASYNQIPLRLAWAITVHKSQGMTLEAAEIDLSKTFETGQGYVALSRLKKLENLRLLGLNTMALKVDSLAHKADKRFKELATIIDEELSAEELLKEAPLFVKKCDGISDLKELKKHKAKLREKKIKGSSARISTYEISYGYLKQNMPLAEIAEKRGMALSTISGHLIKVKKDHPEANLSFYKPKSSILKKVEAAHKKVRTEDGVSIKAMYEYLKGKVTYEDIHLSLAFII
ncbi:MAG: helicase [Bacteroidetes bacterium]|nr:MAG: helicase [Bacteroidota bacterium]MBL1143900.1 helicase [Bacteroidota bacterium]MCB0803703.1 AAA family ATPase [Flavobacteriales bacterium]NOG56701.1 AAA family ATPase [Bacteroidota bacterium]